MNVVSTYNHIYNNVEYVQAVVVSHEDKNIVIITPPVKRFHTNEQWMTSFKYDPSKEASTSVISNYIKKEGIKVLYEDDFGYYIQDNMFICKPKGLSKYFAISFNTGPSSSAPRVDGTSKLEEYRRNKLISERLKFYSYYLKSETGKFDYTVIPNHKYDTSTILIDNKTFITSDKKLIVHSKKIGDKLNNFTQNLIINSSHFKNKTLVDTEYKEHDSSLIFSNINQLKNHNENITQDSRQDFRDTYIYSKQPYFVKIDGEIFLLQNLKKDNKENAIATSMLWKKDGVNYGYASEAEKDVVKLNDNVHTFVLENGTEITSSKNIDSEDVEILELQEGKYASLLRFNHSKSKIMDNFDIDDFSEDDISDSD